MKRCLAVLFCLTPILQGCAGSVLGDAIAGPEVVNKRDDDYCRSIGTTYGTPDYSNCRLTLTTQRSQRRTVTIGGGGDYSASAVPNYDIQAPLPSPIQPTVRCQSVPAGMGTMQTVCR